MAIALVAHTKITSAAGGNLTAPVTSPTINTTGGNFAILFYTFYNGGDYPAIADSYGNTYYNFARYNAFSPALASEMRFTKELTVGASHNWTITQSGLYAPNPVYAMSLYIAVFSGVIAGSNANPFFFSAPWYNDGGNELPPPYTVQTNLSCSGASGGGTDGQLIVMGWGNSDETHNTVVTATDGLGGTPAFTITDSDQASLPLPSVVNYNAGLSYYVQPTATNTTITQTWVTDNLGLYPYGDSQGVMSVGVFTPSAAPPPPPPGVGTRQWLGEMGPVRVYS